MVHGFKRRKILVLDGHDGTGKTTLAKHIAEELGGIYLCPFSGTAGEIMIWSAKSGESDFVSKLSCKLVEHAIEANDAPILIFDRLWMTVFTLIPEAYWREWMPLPPTMLCWADTDTILSRLRERKEKSHDASYHLMYMQKYKMLAQQFSCPILRTDQLSIEACVERLRDWAICFM
jgi:deoxyadenosine/deoxycytidine kinase